MLSTLRKFFAFCQKENRNLFYRSLGLGVLMAVLNGLKYPAIYLVLSDFTAGRATERTIIYGLLILICAVILESLVRARSVMMQCRAGYNECAGKRISIAEHLRYLPMGYFNENSLGRITSVTTNTMEQLGDTATWVVMLTTQGILNTIIIVLFILLFDWRIGLISLAGIAIFALVNHAMQNNNAKLIAEKETADINLVSGILEYIQGITEVKAYNMVGETRQKLDKEIREASRLNTGLEMASNRYIPIQNMILKLTGVVILMASIRFYLHDSMNLLTTVIMAIMSFHVFAGLETMGAYSALLRMVDISVTRGQEILNLPPMDIDGEAYHPKKHDIAVSRIDFAYDKKKIIDGVSLTIPEKTTAAFVGPSGGGKTTLCHLIARFWDVDKGTVSLDGKNVRDYSMDSLMENFSFVFQTVYLFHDTIANNIRFGRPGASMDEVMDAAKKACCHDFIMKLPDGYDTVIGENGTSLSGGEKQRISIARAIMKDAPVIILDEATANVDPENEKDLMEALEALTKGADHPVDGRSAPTGAEAKTKTILMIAHRLKTVRNAGQIFVVDKGRITQQGTHDELIIQDGIYRNFISERKKAVSWKLQA